MKPHEEHQERAPRSVKIALVTVSTSRYRRAEKGEKPSNESERVAVRELKKTKHRVVSSKLVDDNVGQIRLEVLKSIYEDGADAVILMGGTGLAVRDVTIEALRPLFEKELGGFSEIFRVKSYEELGGAAYLSRATAGTVDSRLVYCLPGSPQAVDLGLKLIIPELAHAVHIARG